MNGPAPTISAAWVAEQLRSNLSRVLSAAVCREVLDAMRGGGGDFAHVANLLRGDPYIAAKVVGLADHAARQRRMTVVTLERAVQVLGTRHVEMLVLSAMLTGPLLGASGGSGPARADLWRWVLACGVAGTWLSRHAASDINDADTGALAGEHLAEGLILGLGVLLLDAGLGERYEQVLGAPPRPLGLAMRERARLGVDHYQVTLWALSSMRCPAEICPAAAALAEARDDGATLRARAIEVLAARIAGLDSARSSAWLLDAMPRIAGEEAWEEALPALRAEIRQLAAVFRIDAGPARVPAAARREALLAAGAAIESLVADRLTLMESIGGDLRAQAATALAVERALEESETDPLTGVLNRRGWRQRLGELPTLRGGAVGVLMMDLDHFKTINDTHGHATGDLALVGAGEALRSTEPGPLAVARLGGDEFAAIYPVETPAALLDVARQVQRRLADAPPHGLGLTASAGGVITTVGEVAGGWDQVARRADACLYRAKRDGRDRARVE